MVSFFVRKKSTGKRKKIFLKFFAKKRLFGILFGILYMQATEQQRNLVNL